MIILNLNIVNIVASAQIIDKIQTLNSFLGSVQFEISDCCCCRFDERISSFAEQKFLRDGIDVLMGMRVMSVSNKDISVKIKSSGEVVSLPHGLILWSTGVGTRPVISDLMEQVGQGGRRVLATNEWLQVKGCENVYAVGDCASIAQRKIMGDIANIFKAADVDNSGTLTEDELQDVVDDINVRYPQVELYLKSKHVRSIKDLLTDSEGNPKKEVDIKAFESALSGVDSQMKSLPATAQVHLSGGFCCGTHAQRSYCFCYCIGCCSARFLSGKMF